jgi:MFS family permease
VSVGIGALRVLRERNFALLFFGQTISLIGSGSVPVALSFAVLDLRGSVADLGLVLAMRSAATVCFVLIGGLVSDRWSPRGVMLAADAIRGLVHVGLGIAVILRAAELWHFFVAELIHGSATGFFMPASTSIVPQAVDRSSFQEANALRGLSDSVGYVVGPALGGLLVATVGAGWAIGADGASYVVGLMFLALMRVRSHVSPIPSRPWHDLMTGFRGFMSHRWLIVANVHASLMNMMVLPAFFVVGAAVARGSLGGGASWGLVVGSFGVGLVCGGLVALVIRLRRPMLIGLAGAAVFALPLSALALSAPVGLIAGAAALAGVQNTYLNAVWETTLQEQVTADLLSRVSSIDWLGSLILQPLGYALAGLISSTVLGLGGTLWLGAGVAAMISAVAAAMPSIRGLESEARSTRAKSG